MLLPPPLSFFMLVPPPPSPPAQRPRLARKRLDAAANQPTKPPHPPPPTLLGCHWQQCTEAPHIWNRGQYDTTKEQAIAAGVDATSPTNALITKGFFLLFGKAYDVRTNVLFHSPFSLCVGSLRGGGRRYEKWGRRRGGG